MSNHRVCGLIVFLGIFGCLLADDAFEFDREVRRFAGKSTISSGLVAQSDDSSVRDVSADQNSYPHCSSESDDASSKVSPAFDPNTFADKLEYLGVAVEEPGWHVWGTSPVMADDGKVHLFCARWPISARFDPGWRIASQIAHYVGDGPEGPFKFSDVALSGTGKDTWDKTGVHNPAIHRVCDKYVLLYISNTGLEGHPANQCIGMATADSPYGPWQKVGEDGLILAPPEDESYWNYGSGCGVNNPAFLQHPDGRFFLFFKSRPGNRGGTKMGLAIADKLEGPYVQKRKPITANDRAIEDGYAFASGGKIYLLTTDNHGMLKRGGGLLWVSDDGENFESIPRPGFDLFANYLPSEDRSQAKRIYGGQLKFERPQVLMIDGRPAYLYMPSGFNIKGGNGTISHVLRVRY
ncbi:Beta-xylosidase [Anaerohalosphaera lusitana]|uniref:Beta-xylosidase n=1 Tax=Anaerohalosphaera lusitana TaxID=1936003 RepID=A0A1U9NN81_9BACT|nr:glycoside hydrolase family protein [Anaerohalosphaera lusitana]AQT69070.1 Beta-xylosidase [Anaerohalosphaera lusitana]